MDEHVNLNIFKYVYGPNKQTKKQNQKIKIISSRLDYTSPGFRELRP